MKILSFFVEAASTTVNPNELFTLQIHSLVGHSYQIEKIASQLFSCPLVIILRDRANACSVSVAVSRTPNYPTLIYLIFK